MSIFGSNIFILISTIVTNCACKEHERRYLGRRTRCYLKGEANDTAYPPLPLTAHLTFLFFGLDTDGLGGATAKQVAQETAARLQFAKCRSYGNRSISQHPSNPGSNRLLKLKRFAVYCLHDDDDDERYPVVAS